MPRGLPASYIKKAKRELGKGASWHDIFKRAWELYKGSKIHKAVSGNPSKSSRKKKKGGRSVPKKKKTKRRTVKIPLEVAVAGIGTVFTPPCPGWSSPIQYAQEGNWEWTGRSFLRGFLGVDENGGLNVMAALNPIDFNEARYWKMLFWGAVLSKVRKALMGRRNIFAKVPIIGKFIS